MRTGKLGKLLTAALLGMAAPAAVFADPPPAPGSTSVFSQMLHKRPTATVSRIDPAKDPARRPPPKPAAGDPLVKARDRELANWLRRTDVCLKLMEIADQTGDESLRKKAQELDRRARAAYEHRIAELGGDPHVNDDDGLHRDRDQDKEPAGTRSAGVVRRNRHEEEERE